MKSIVLQLFRLICASFVLLECNRPLGLQDGRILNSQLSSSSHSGYLYIGYGKTSNMKAEFARLNNSLAWCSPSRRKFGSTFIEIDLNQQMNISGVATQGFRAIFSYYVKQYKVAYSKERNTWKFLEKVWPGNSDTQTVVKNTFNTVISTRYLRIYPVTWNIRVCMRLELYGCTNLTMDTNPETPVVPTPTVTVPSTTVQTLQSTVTSSSHVTPTPREKTTTASKESVAELADEPAQSDQDVGEEHFQDDKPVRFSTTLIVALSVTSVFVVVVMVPAIMFVIFLHQRKQTRRHCPGNCDGIPLHSVVIDENLCNQDFYGTCKYDVPIGKCDAVEFNLLNRGAV